jgi:tetratricopeptide (TPR) repeat protein
MNEGADMLQAGVSAFEAGRLDEAAALLARVPEQGPHGADALHLRGLVALRRGQADEAEALIRRAIAANGNNPAYHSNLGAALHRQGRMAQAEQALRLALVLRPAYAAALSNLGLVLLDSGRAADAAPCLEQAVAAAPRDPRAHFNLGNAFYKLGRFAPAAASLWRAVELRPGFAEAHSNLANVLEALGDAAGAVAAMEAASALRPNDVALRVNLGKMLGSAGRHLAAGEAFAEAGRLDPTSTDAMMGLSLTAFHQGEGERALALVEAVLERLPDRAAAHAVHAKYLESVHRLDEAEAAARRALVLDADDRAALRVLAQLAHRRGDLAEARTRFEALAAESGEDAGVASVELGQVLDRLGETAAAFAAVSRGKALQAAAPAARRHDSERYRARVRRIHGFATSAPMSDWPEVPGAGPVPGFFVGFPRSGTTLMERMLAAHRDLVTVEERPLLHSVWEALERPPFERGYPEGLGQLTAEQVETLRQRYWQTARTWIGTGHGNRRVLDKLPLNIIHLPLVRRLFPTAPVLVALRDPRDVVLSAFLQAFEINDSMLNFATLDDSARLYELVMGLWLDMRERLGLKVLEYRYEDLIADPRGVMERVLAHFGLPWQDRVLTPVKAETGKMARTPSYIRVEQPLDASAIGRWRRYRTELEPVLPRLARFVEAFGYSAE